MQETVQEASPSSREPMRKSWKIAWVHTADSGGSKRAAFDMVRELVRRGHVVDEYIVRIGEPDLINWPLRPFVRESYQYLFPRQTFYDLRPYLVKTWFDLAQNLLKRRSLRSILEAVAAHINSRGYDFVHVDHCSPSYTVLLTTMVTPPSVVYSHEVSGARYRINDAPSLQLKSSWIRRAYSFGCDLATGIWSRVQQGQDLRGVGAARVVFTNSCYSKEAMFQRARRFSLVCRYGVDTVKFRPLGLPVEQMVLSAGRIVEAKQHHLVIEAVAKIHRSRRPRVVIATPESETHQEDLVYLSRITEMAKTADVDLSIRCKPSEAELVALYSQALVLVFVPIMEPFGLVALEAMACGTPVIGVREGGVRESVLDGQSGILVDRDSTELAQAIDRFVQNPDLRSRLGQQAGVYVRSEWVWARSIDYYEKEVGKLLTGENIANTSSDSAKVEMATGVKGRVLVS
jgi:glycosyltransferase involved in cell wall biosynthesis